MPNFKPLNKLTLMIQGTTSDAGKSTLVAALGRVLSRRNYHVAPFKPQNMALNSAVTEDGGEIGRAQALQAEACGIAPHTDMNPILLKPSSDMKAQVIIHGKPIEDMDAKIYHDYKKTAMNAVMASYTRLQSQYEVILVEGAGSPAEINLREGDIANMGFAEEADCPVILIADIDRGGVFAHIVGTLALLSQSEQDRVIGFVINRFRGDISLLKPGLDWLEDYTNKPVLGVLPYLQNLYIDAEDAISTLQEKEKADFNVVIPVLPRISNHTDFDPLRLHNDINVIFVGEDQPIPPSDLLILPGTKNVREDLNWLRKNGWEGYISRHLRYGGKVIGICGGYQMLGLTIEDNQGIEGKAGQSEGLSYIPMHTSLMPAKTLLNLEGKLNLSGRKSPITGYEIHCGISSFSHAPSSEPPLTFNDKHHDGYAHPDNQIFGCYLHGLFDHPNALTLLLNWAGLDTEESISSSDSRHKQIERLADCVEKHLNWDKLPFDLNFPPKS